jgi:hypothetical protein
VALAVAALLMLVNPTVAGDRGGPVGHAMRAWRATGWRRGRELARRPADATRAGRFDGTGVPISPTPGIPDAEPPSPRL